MTEIATGTFEKCSSASSLTLNDALISIRKDAFKSCTSLNGDIVFPDTVNLVESGAFESCTQIDDVHVNFTGLQSGAFASGPATNLYVRSPYLSHYGGIGASFDTLTVADWTSYPDPMP